MTEESKTAVKKEQKLKKPRRGAYLLPNLFTTFGLFAGFYSIISAIKENYTFAAIAVIVAMFLDGIDGRVARMTNTQTDFGAQYDSLADMVSFGLAPALVMYLWSLQNMTALGPVLGKLGWLVAFFYAAMAALRLARFNVQIETVEKKYFRGLASPAAATLLMSFIWVCEEWGLDGNKLYGKDLWLPALILTVLAGSLMISPLAYNSFKDNNREDKNPYSGVFLIVLLMVLVFLDPPKVFFGVFLLYALSGPVLSYHRYRQQKAAKKALKETE